MLYPERVLNAAKALPDGCLGHIYHQPANAYRPAALISLYNYKQHKHLPSRSTIQPHHTRTLSNNRRTLSLAPRGKCAWDCFASFFNLRDQADCCPPGRPIHLY